MKNNEAQGRTFNRSRQFNKAFAEYAQLCGSWPVLILIRFEAANIAPQMRKKHGLFRVHRKLLRVVSDFENVRLTTCSRFPWKQDKAAAVRPCSLIHRYVTKIEYILIFLRRAFNFALFKTILDEKSAELIPSFHDFDDERSNGEAKCLTLSHSIRCELFVVVVFLLLFLSLNLFLLNRRHIVSRSLNEMKFTSPFAANGYFRHFFAAGRSEKKNRSSR